MKSHRKYRYQKDQLSKCNFFLTLIIIIYCLKSEYLNTTTVLLILYLLNCQNGCHSHRKFVYVIARPQEAKKKITTCFLPLTQSTMYFLVYFLLKNAYTWGVSAVLWCTFKNLQHFYIGYFEGGNSRQKKNV